MLLFLTLSGIFLSILLLYFNARKFSSTIYLGLFFFLLSFYGFVQYVSLYSGSVFLVSVFYVNVTFVLYLIGPMLYWYIRSTLTDDSTLKSYDIWHFLPMIIFLLFALPYILTPFSYKQEIAMYLVKNPDNLALFRATYLHKLIPIEIIFLSRPVFLLGYMIVSLAMFMKFIQNNKRLSVLSHQYFMTKWLSIFFVFLFVLVSGQILSLVVSFENKDKSIFFTLNVMQVLSGIGLTGLLCSPFFFPGILYGLPRMPESEKSNLKNTGITGTEAEGARRNGFNLESGYLRSIGEKIDNCMLEHAPYLHAEFNLTQLSVLLKVPVHHLSYFFREVKKQSFNDYRNEWRINYSKKLIADGKADDLTLEAIGLLSGFSTRNTFFTAFKKSQGISPGMYVEQLAQKEKLNS